MDEQQIRKIIRNELKDFILIDKYTFQKNIQMFDGRNIQLGRDTGTKIGTAADQKLGFYGENPVIQPSDITAMTETGVDTDGAARVKINQIRDLLRNLGLMA